MTSTVNAQRGAALIVALVFLVLLTIMGMTAMNFSTMEEKMAGNLKSQYTAFQAAESALLDAEQDVYKNVSNTTKFTATGDAGLWLPPVAGKFAWDLAAWTVASKNTRKYGEYTGAAPLPIGANGVAEQPRYLIEDIPDPTDLKPGESGPDKWKKGPGPGTKYYRITALGYGATLSSRVVLQVVVKK